MCASLSVCVCVCVCHGDALIGSWFTDFCSDELVLHLILTIYCCPVKLCVASGLSVQQRGGALYQSQRERPEIFCMKRSPDDKMLFSLFTWSVLLDDNVAFQSLCYMLNKQTIFKSNLRTDVFQAVKKLCQVLDMSKVTMFDFHKEFYIEYSCHYDYALFV